MQNELNPWVLMFVLSATIASFAQMLLKKSAMEDHGSVIREYLNAKVILGYGLMFVGMLLGVVGYANGVSIRSGSVTESIGNVWVVFLSWLFFREAVTKHKILGNILIIAGIVICNLA